VSVEEVERLALKLLVAREHSRLELARKLATRGCDGEFIAAALDRLTADGSIDEARLADHYVAERVGRGFGPLRIRAELREKGVAEDLIERSLALLCDQWPTCLASTHDRRFGSEPPADRAEFGKRARFLEQRGFSTDSIRRFLRWTD
jgi:regulatory protein